MPITEIAKKIRDAEASKRACPPIRSLLKDKDIQSAYQIQELNINVKKEKGQLEVGKKIGLTSKKVQAQLGVDQPDFGILLDQMQITNRGQLSHTDLMQPKAEAEIAFILKSDLRQENINLETVKAAIDYALPAIEVVGSRIQDWDIQITDTIADNASSSHFVLGDTPVQLTDLDLENCAMQLYKNSTLASEGKGKDCLGNPLNAVVWLAQKMNELGNPLKKDEIILSGALGPMVSLTAGDEIRSTIEGLGEVSFKVN